MSDEARKTEEAVDELLRTGAGAMPIVYAATLIGTATDTDGEKPWVHDTWALTFKHLGKTATFSFKTGIGLRAEATATQKQQAMWHTGCTPNDTSRGTIIGRRYYAHLQTLRKPKAPNAAGALYSLLLDSQAAHQSFMDWCGDYGYDTDSIKAFATYNACCENAKKLATIFNRDLQAKLQEALQDY